jgi:hypothetical protein
MKLRFITAIVSSREMFSACRQAFGLAEGGGGLFVNVMQRHIRAASQKGLDDLAAQPAARPRHQRHFAAEVEGL